MNKKDLPVALLQALNRINVQLRSLTKENDNLILINYKDNNLVQFKDSDLSSRFKFDLIKLELSPNGTPLFSFEIIPASNTDNNNIVKQCDERKTLLEFQTWISWLKVYDKSHLTPQDEFFKKYQDEFYSDFEIIDDDADASPFSTEQQLFLDKYLNFIETKLLPESFENKEIQEILDSTRDLRTRLGKESKKQIIKKFSAIFAKMRMSSIKLLGEFYSATKKELFKRLIEGGLDGISTLLDNV